MVMMGSARGAVHARNTRWGHHPAAREDEVVVGLTDFKEVTVQDDQSIDVSEFDHRMHAGIPLDGAGDVLTLWWNREVLQGRPKVARGERSVTMGLLVPVLLGAKSTPWRPLT